MSAIFTLYVKFKGYDYSKTGNDTKARSINYAKEFIKQDSVESVKVVRFDDNGASIVYLNSKSF